MRIIECDRCHKQIEKPDVIGHVKITYHAPRTDAVVSASPTHDWDFCEKCMEAIEKFVSAETKKAPEAKAPETKKKIDVGKIRALAAAGWTLKAIAEEMGCSQPTVSKYLKKEEADEAESVPESNATD